MGKRNSLRLISLNSFQAGKIMLAVLREKSFLRSNYIKNIFMLISGSTVSQGILVVSSLILTRLYTPSDFGIFSLYSATVTIFAVIGCLRYDLAIMLPKKDENATALLFLSIFITLITSFLLFIIIFFAKDFIISKIYYKIESFIFLVPLGALFNSLFLIFNAWNSRNRLYKNIANGKITQAISLVLISVALAGIFHSHNGMIWGYLLGYVLGFMVLLFTAMRENTIDFSKLSKRRLLLNLKRYEDFPKYQSFSVFFSTISQNIPSLLLPVLYSPQIAGYYALTSRILIIPSSLIGQSVREVFYQRATEIYNKTKDIKDIFLKTMIGLAKIYIIPSLILLFFAPVLFTAIFGKNWLISGIYAQINIFWSFIGLINIPAIMSIPILGLQKFSMIFEISLLFFRISSLYLGFWIFNNHFASIGLNAFVGVIFNIILILYLYNKLNNKKVFEEKWINSYEQ